MRKKCYENFITNFHIILNLIQNNYKIFHGVVNYFFLKFIDI